MEPKNLDRGADEHAHVELASECVHHDATPVGDRNQMLNQLSIASLRGNPQLDSREPGG